MSLSCNREAFKPAEGCPEIEADLTFPDFESCEMADTGRLKSVSRLDLQKSPAFPMFIPANDPLPVSIPDIDFDYECPLDGVSEDYQPIIISSGSAHARGGVKVDRTSTGCSMTGIDIEIDLPYFTDPGVLVHDGAVTYTFSTSLNAWF